jgi:hypothetical protein
MATTAPTIALVVLVFTLFFVLTVSRVHLSLGIRDDTAGDMSMVKG